jgi:iron(III) transport system substrate-binding protein
LLALLVACAPSAPSPTAAPKQAEPAPAAKPEAAKPASPGAEKARQEAEAKGLKFVASHDEIVEKAKQEGTLKGLTSADPKSIKALKEGFSAKYPFIKFDLQEITGREAQQRFGLEMKAGAATEWDIIHISEEDFLEYEPFVEKYDLLGMAEAGVVQITSKMIYPDGRNLVGMASQIGVVTYNKNLLPTNLVPKTWEDLLKPELKGRKMLAETRANTMAGLVPGMGEAQVLDFAKKLAAQEPIWTRGNTRALTAMAAGEYSLHSATYFHSSMRAISLGAETLAVAVVEPVPVRIALGTGIQKGAKNPHAALLFIEYYAGPEGQKIMDEVEPLKGSIYFGQTEPAKLIAGKKTSVADWTWWPKMGGIEERIGQAYGFPKAEIQG